MTYLSPQVLAQEQHPDAFEAEVRDYVDQIKVGTNFEDAKVWKMIEKLDAKISRLESEPKKSASEKITESQLLVYETFFYGKICEKYHKTGNCKSALDDVRMALTVSPDYLPAVLPHAKIIQGLCSTEAPTPACPEERALRSKFVRGAIGLRMGISVSDQARFAAKNMEKAGLITGKNATLLKTLRACAGN